MARVNVTSSRKKKIRVTSKPSRAVDPAKVAKAFRAEKVGEDSQAGDFPWTLAHMAEELSQSLHSTGGRPALTGYHEKHKLPFKNEDWEFVRRISSNFPKVGDTQIAAVLFHLAVKKMTDEEANRELEKEIQ